MHEVETLTIDRDPDGLHGFAWMKCGDNNYHHEEFGVSEQDRTDGIVVIGCSKCGQRTPCYLKDMRCVHERFLA